MIFCHLQQIEMENFTFAEKYLEKDLMKNVVVETKLNSITRPNKILKFGEKMLMFVSLRFMDSKI